MAVDSSLRVDRGLTGVSSEAILRPLDRVETVVSRLEGATSGGGSLTPGRGS